MANNGGDDDIDESKMLIVRFSTNYKQASEKRERPKYNVFFGTGNDDPRNMHDWFPFPLPTTEYKVLMYAVQAFLQWAENPSSAATRRRHIRDADDTYDDNVLERLNTQNTTHIVFMVENKAIAGLLEGNFSYSRDASVKRRQAHIASHMQVLKELFESVAVVSEVLDDPEDPEKKV